MLLLQYAFIVVLCFLLVMIATTLIVSSFGSTLWVLKLTQLLSQLFIFIIPPIIFLIANRVDVTEQFGFKNRQPFKVWMVALLLLLIALPLVSWTEAVNEKMVLPEFCSSIEAWMRSNEDAANVLTKQFLTMDTPVQLLVNLFIMALVPAIGEEMTFRGCIQKMLVDRIKTPHIAIIVTSIIFSAVHLQFYGFLPRMILGIILGYTFYYTGTLFIPSLMHFCNNASVILLAYILGPDAVDETAGIAGYDSSLLWAAISLAGVVLVIILLSKKSVKRLPQQ